MGMDARQEGLKNLPIYMSPVIPMTAEEFDGSELDTFFRKVGIGAAQWFGEPSATFLPRHRDRSQLLRLRCAAVSGLH